VSAEEGTEEIVASFRKSASEVVCIGFNEWRGQTRIFVRIYVPSVDYEDAFVRTKKGISLTADKYPQLRDAIENLGNVFKPETVVAVIPKTYREQVRVGFNEFRGQRLVYVRSFVRISEDKDDWVPTRKGVSLRVEQYPKLLEGIRALGKRLGL